MIINNVVSCVIMFSLVYLNRLIMLPLHFIHNPVQTHFKNIRKFSRWGVPGIEPVTYNCLLDMLTMRLTT